MGRQAIPAKQNCNSTMKSCKHCGKKSHADFCCSGCETAYNIDLKKPNNVVAVEPKDYGLESFVTAN